ncbi:type II toxin-antitoxin system RelE/ParE family toxin [Photorhabdus noenieputensis]|uniref:type II toxin-antitoxin system RelE/ParE family toxin n=1 Tax=Photorhabdus noenieputensis TaxID=1208607 RepID=UPI001BD46751|nr:type II toxin-antitoxin system RelE/ParE family toxin [Photorhabdus noenieputensis]MBS9437033.1 type II toxin-antitoxin system RelE/ParE family toxin [Photorhabdus noenieputensis]MCK3670404.1 type II toxin-antitoxin system RelE/ParE family toxin [Photorhabdus noenieputensis]
MDYVLTEATETDLRAIISYTRKQWGDAQVHHYITTLKQGIGRLACGKGSFKDMSEFFPALRMARCEHHYVFCLPRKDAPALIVAIFHERMDLLARLADRLKL